MELLGGQNRFPCSHLSEFFDVPAGCDENNTEHFENKVQNKTSNKV